MISIVIEWDNVRLTNAPRAVRMLEELRRQVVDLDGRVEIILVHDPGELSSAEIEDVLGRTGFRSAGVDIRAVEADGEHYYEMKNIGAGLARGPLVVFVDSDVIPEAGWLRSLLEPFARPDVDAVGGSAYVGPTRNTYEKAFALFWQFPLRSAGGAPTPQGWFWANSCAFRREVLAAHRWPRSPFIRYQNVLFNKSLTRAGVRIWRVPDARAEHPLPRRMQFVRTALSDGHDAAVRITAGSGWRRAVVGPPYALAMLAGRVLRYTRKILPAERREAVGMTGAEIPAALAVACAYAVVAFAGFVATIVAPDAVPRRFSV